MRPASPGPVPPGSNRPRRLSVLLLMITAWALAGCEGGRDPVVPGPGSGIAPNALRGQSITVGSKEFTEQVILGQLTVQALRAAGAEVADETRLAGSATTRRALIAGEIDMYLEYTGTAWITFMSETRPIPDEREQYRAVARRDLRENGISWLQYAPFNNTYAIAVRREAAGPLGVRTISDLARLSRERPHDASLCVAEEFLSRDDGLPGLERAYAFRFPRETLLKLDEGLVYNQVDSGARCNFGEVFTTDGRIAANDLVVLEDDRRFFPKYNPALTVETDVLRGAPSLADVMRPITRQLDARTMRRLNGQVDIEGMTEEEVVERWLAEEGLVR